MSQIELEAFAVVLALLHFHAYIYGKPITVMTDANALR